MYDGFMFSSECHNKSNESAESNVFTMIYRDLS